MRRRKHKRGKNKLSSKIWKIGLGILIPMLILDTYLLINSRFFKIKSVDVVLDRVNCTDENTIKNDILSVGQYFFNINGKNIEEQVKNKYFCIKSVSVSKYIPNRVKLKVSGREAVAVLVILKNIEAKSFGLLENLVSESASETYESEIADQFLVDSEGILFARPKGENVPKIYLRTDKLTLGKNIDEKIVENSLKILSKIKSFGVEVKEARIYSKDILIVNPIIEKPKLYFLLENAIDVQLASLQLILEEAKINDKEMEFIDLRYDKPVVKYAQKKKNNEQRIMN